MGKPTIIILGHSRSGKTTVANWIAEALGGKAANVSDVLVEWLVAFDSMQQWGGRHWTPADVMRAKSLPYIGPVVRRMLYQLGRGAESAHKVCDGRGAVDADKMLRLWSSQNRVSETDGDLFHDLCEMGVVCFAGGAVKAACLIADGFSRSPAVIIDYLARDHCAIAGVRTMEELKACVEHGIGTHFIWCEGGERIHDGTITDCYAASRALGQRPVHFLPWRDILTNRKDELLRELRRLRALRPRTEKGHGMFWTEVAGLIATAIAVTGVILNNRRLRACFIVFLFSNGIALVIHVSVGVYSLCLRDLIFLALAIEGWIRWGRKETPCSCQK